MSLTDMMNAPKVRQILSSEPISAAEARTLLTNFLATQRKYVSGDEVLTRLDAVCQTLNDSENDLTEIPRIGDLVQLPKGNKIRHPSMDEHGDDSGEPDQESPKKPKKTTKKSSRKEKKEKRKRPGRSDDSSTERKKSKSTS